MRQERLYELVARDYWRLQTTFGRAPLHREGAPWLDLIAVLTEVRAQYELALSKMAVDIWMPKPL